MSEVQDMEQILRRWVGDKEIQPNIVFSTSLPAVAPSYAKWPENLRPEVREAFKLGGIRDLYSHQRESWDAVKAGNNVVLTSGTASGKSLCYWMPILDTLLRDPSSRALLLFPTKALAQDQLNKVNGLLRQFPVPIGQAATFDGDTPADYRKEIRDKARILISNPDMLHMGILPHHTLWEQFFTHLNYVVVDEIHTYRGIFGSHVANVLRRLNRVMSHYGTKPWFIMTSATIGNAAELASTLAGDQVEVIASDGSGRGQKQFLIYNPPLSNPELGIRKSAIQEAVRLAAPLHSGGKQTILFSRTRRSVEILLTALQQAFPDHNRAIRGYRSGYLPSVRREIEQGLRENTVRTVAATNALELGIDLGGLDASILVGYPGTIASTTQQVGRAGRKSQDSVAVLVTTSDPIDQYLARNPDYLLGLHPENALVDPDHLVILIDHLQCAAFELPIAVNEDFGTLPGDTLRSLLDYLAGQGLLHLSGGRYYWMDTRYPSATFSLRSASAERVELRRPSERGPELFGTVDRTSAFWMVHAGAIYLHEGQQYLVDNLDLAASTAWLHPVSEDYYTEPLESLDLNILSRRENQDYFNFWLGYGDLHVESTVTGFRKLRNISRELLGTGQVDLPPYEYDTTGMWLGFKEESVNRLRSAGAWLNDPNDYGPQWQDTRRAVRARDDHRCRQCGLPEQGQQHHVHHLVPYRLIENKEHANRFDNLVTLCPSCHQRAEMLTYVRSGLSGLAYALRHLLPLHLMCDHEDIQVQAEAQSPLLDGSPGLIVFDNFPGGIGLSHLAFERIPSLLGPLEEFIRSCPCTQGCPSCIGPAGEAGYAGKTETLAILEELQLG